MVNGWYVIATRESSSGFVLVAGPFREQEKAERTLTSAKKIVNDLFVMLDGDKFETAYIEIPSRMAGMFNDKLWVKPEWNELE